MSDYYNNNQYDGGGYPPPFGNPYDRESFRDRISRRMSNPPERGLVQLGLLTGGAILVHLVLQSLYSLVICGSDTLYYLYIGNEQFSLICDMLYSFFCVALPFLPLLFIEKRMNIGSGTLPYGRAYADCDVFLLITAGLGVFFIANIASSYFAAYCEMLGHGFVSYDTAVEESLNMTNDPFTLAVTVLRTAVVPAFLEEFVFRGVVMQPLRRYGDGFAIFASAFIFGMLHGNMTQMPFAIIAGVMLGYVSVVSGSMWVNTGLHLLNNTVSVLYSAALVYAGEGKELILSSVITYGIIIIGIIAFVFYAYRTPRMFKLYPGPYGETKGKIRLYFLMPTMLLALLILGFTILKDIK